MNIVLGIILVFFGLFFLWLSFKGETVKHDVTATILKGFIAGFGGIILGILFLLNKIKW